MFAWAIFWPLNIACQDITSLNQTCNLFSCFFGLIRMLMDCDHQRCNFALLILKVSFAAASLSTQTPVCWVWRCLTVQETPHPKHLVGSKWYSWQPGFQKKQHQCVCVLMTLCSARHGTCVLMTLCSARHGTCVLMSLCLARHGTCVPMSLCLARHGTWHLTIGVMCDCVCVSCTLSL